MSKHHGTETLNFEGSSGYYGSVAQGYGGFVWSDVDFMNASYWQNVETSWCDTGYQNTLDGSGLAFTRSLAPGHYYKSQPYNPSYAYLRSENIHETFSLKSMVAASAWETNQGFKFTSYVYRPNTGFVVKASVVLHLSQTAQTIDFQHLSAPTLVNNPFGNISAVRITSAAGTYGNTCSYGAGQPTYGNQLAFDDLTITWNGKVPHGTGHLPAVRHHLPTPAAQLLDMHASHSHAADAGNAASHQVSGSYHAEIMSLTGHDSAGLTAQFHLPSLDHFGT